MLAYHGDPAIRAEYLGRVAQHRAADQLLQSHGYWRDGKGCAVGCTVHSSNHADYESLLGIPQMLARLEDAIFEGLPVEGARLWPERFLSAIRPGQDLGRVGWQLLYWLLTDPVANPGITHPVVADAVRQCALVISPLAAGHAVSRSAANAAWSALCAACAESALCAESAESAAWEKIADKLIELIEAR